MNHFLLVGAGGTASYLLPALVRWLDATHGEEWLLAICDGDTIEMGNIARQAHALENVGANKAEALAAGHDRIVPIPEYLGSLNIDRLIQDGTTVLITVDNFPVRKRIEDHAKTLDNVVVINGGNEEHSGSVQLWVREASRDVTPPIGFMHPEIAEPGLDRAEMSCQQIAQLPGGGQTAIANMAAATHILTALQRLHAAPTVGALDWHELQFDALTGEVERIDYRTTRAWSELNAS